MSFLNRLMVMLALCTVLLCCIALGFVNSLVVVLATCAALAATAASTAIFDRRNKLSRMTSKIPAEAGQVSQLNSSVYKLHSPSGEPSMDVVFFHGFQHGDYKDAHLSTWNCGDGSSIWPQTWLVEKFPDARILSVSYDASVIKSCEGGTIDMHLISENLTSDLLTAKIGQEPCRPVVLVGHSFGGLVIKHICVYASSTTGRLKRNSEKKFQLTAFLENVKGIFFYSTPHQGVFGHIAEHFVAEGPLLEYVKTLSKPRARVNSDFDNLCGQDGQYKMWQIAGVGESLPTKLGSFSDIVVEEASARYGTSFNIVERADHISVCRPLQQTCRSFSALTNFLEGVGGDSKAMVYGLPDYPTALERRVFEVQQKLATSPVVGIVGMGGIGKTTIAKQLFNNLSPQFEYTCFVDNVKGIEVHKSSDQVLSQFRRNGSRVDQNSLEWSGLKRKKSLITMDDVDSENQVRILPRLDEFGDGSRLIFTTRDEGVLKAIPNCAIYKVDFLNADEATKLFCQHAFQQQEIPDDLTEVNWHLEENVKKVVEKCAGLPLTLEVMGCYLRDHKTNARVWKETLDKLGKAQSVDGLRNDRVWSSLRVSYDALSLEEQGMFIEAGTYFFEQPVETALAAWSTAFGHPESRWANLLRTSMVKEVDRTELNPTLKKQIKYKQVWVHQQLRDLAKQLSQGAIISKGVGESYRAIDLLSASEVQAQTSILRLWADDPGGYPNLQLELLDKFEKLKYLDLYYMLPEGSSNALSRNLCLLSCTHRLSYQAPHLCISLEDMTNLAFLKLVCVEMAEESLEGLGKLSNMRLLFLDGIWGPSRLPDNFGHLSQLKRLELTEVRFTALPDSFGNLSALEVLLLCRIPVVKLPESFGNLSSLATLVIQKCYRLESLPESFGHLSSLKELHIMDCDQLRFRQPTQIDLHEAIETAHRIETNGLTLNLSSLAYLCVYGCRNLKTLPASFELLLSLEELELYVSGLQTLPESIGQFKSLQRLIIKQGQHLDTLPDSFGNLPALTYLCLQECESLQRLPANFGNLLFLQVLRVESCRKLQRLPDNFGQLSALKRLFIRGADELEELPDSFGNLSSLETFSIAANKLQRLPVSIGQLPALKKLDVRAEMLSSLPEELGDLSSLEILRIGNCGRLKTLPESLGRISSLRAVILHDCSELKSLPDSLGKTFSPHGDRSAETRSPVAGHPSQKASTGGLWLHVYKCPFLDKSVLQPLGWIEADEKDFVRGGHDSIFVGCFGKWYVRKFPVRTADAAELNNAQGENKG